MWIESGNSLINLDHIVDIKLEDLKVVMVSINKTEYSWALDTKSEAEDLFNYLAKKVKNPQEISFKRYELKD